MKKLRKIHSLKNKTDSSIKHSGKRYQSYHSRIKGVFLFLFYFSMFLFNCSRSWCLSRAAEETPPQHVTSTQSLLTGLVQAAKQSPWSTSGVWKLSWIAIHLSRRVKKCGWAGRRQARLRRRDQREWEEKVKATEKETQRRALGTGSAIRPSPHQPVLRLLERAPHPRASPGGHTLRARVSASGSRSKVKTGSTCFTTIYLPSISTYRREEYVKLDHW